MVCKNCGYSNRDGVGFCRHCGIPLKEKSRRAAKRASSVKKAQKVYEEPRGEFSLDSLNDAVPPDTREREEERTPKRGGNFKTATIAIGIIVIACVAAFCVFAFDLVSLPGSGGDITVDSVDAAITDTPAPDPTPTLTPVPTVAPTPTKDYGSLFIIPSD
jgi:uncharacterized membrane protein YvbJ